MDVGMVAAGSSSCSTASTEPGTSISAKVAAVRAEPIWEEEVPWWPEESAPWTCWLEDATGDWYWMEQDDFYASEDYPADGEEDLYVCGVNSTLARGSRVASKRS